MASPVVLLVLLCEVLGGACRVPRGGIERAVEHYIHERYKGSSAEVTIEFRSVPDDLVVRGKEFTLRVSEEAIPALSGHVSLPVEVLANGRVDRRFMVSVRVRTFDTVLVAARQLGRHEELTVADIRHERIETTIFAGAELIRDSRLVGLRTKRIINAGAVLTSGVTEPVPDVPQGTPVTLIVTGNHIRLSMEAVAKEDGMRGHRVAVQRVGSTARVEATVLDRKTVEMRVDESVSWRNGK